MPSCSQLHLAVDFLRQRHEICRLHYKSEFYTFSSTLNLTCSQQLSQLWAPLAQYWAGTGLADKDICSGSHSFIHLFVHIFLFSQIIIYLFKNTCRIGHKTAWIKIFFLSQNLTERDMTKYLKRFNRMRKKFWNKSRLRTSEGIWRDRCNFWVPA